MPSLANSPALFNLARKCKGCPDTLCKGCHETGQKPGLPGTPVTPLAFALRGAGWGLVGFLAVALRTGSWVKLAFQSELSFRLKDPPRIVLPLQAQVGPVGVFGKNQS